MLLKVINREDFEILFISHYSGGFDKTFIVYYVTTNDIKFYRMNYPIDSVLQEALTGNLDKTEFLIGAIERKHNLHKEVTFEQMNVTVETWGNRCYNLSNSYFKKQNRENKINQIIK